MQLKTTAGMVLIVDDDRATRLLLSGILGQHYEVVTASSGREALRLFTSVQPDLVVMDGHMPGMDGFEVSLEIRKQSNVPIIFVTANNTLKGHLAAYDSGCTGLLTKPINAEVLLKKVTVALERYKKWVQSEAEKNQLQRLAQCILSSADQSNELVRFMRSAISVATYENLVSALVEAARGLQLSCLVRVTHKQGAVSGTTNGDACPIDDSVLDVMSGMGAEFQFGKQFVINHRQITIVALNSLVQPNYQGLESVRECLRTLAQAAQAVAENIDIRCTVARQAEQMQLALSRAELSLENLKATQYATIADVHVLLEGLAANVEKGFSWLDATQAQEAEISETMQHSISQVLTRLRDASSFEAPAAAVIQALHSGYGNESEAVELF